MINVEVLGVGVWSKHIGSWGDLCAGLDGGNWPEASPPAPSLLPPAIRRRAPLAVKMAIHVMQQACEMSCLGPEQLATVFSSSFGDMDLTDRICSTLSTAPHLTSPTYFHNSVHNATTGYWTIATGVRKPANAISAFGSPPAVSLLEAASQAVFERMPVLLVCGEVKPPAPLGFTTSKKAPFSAAMILVPAGSGVKPMANLEVALEEGRAMPIRDKRLPDELGDEPDAFMLNLLATIPGLSPDSPSATFQFGLSERVRLRVNVFADSGASG